MRIIAIALSWGGAAQTSSSPSNPFPSLSGICSQVSLHKNRGGGFLIHVKILVALVLASAVVHAQPLKTADLEKLRDPTKREAEIARLTGNKSKSYTLARARIFDAPQRNGAPPLLVLCPTHEYKSSVRSTFLGEYEIEKPEELFGISTSSARFLTKPDLDPVRKAPLMIFNSKGKEIRPFAGNNYTDEGYYYDFDQDGILDRGDATNHSVDEAPDHSVSVFELRTIEPEPRTLLEVIFNWHPKSAGNVNDWSFTCFDENNDGIAEIGFGPAEATNPKEQRRFVFRRDAATGRYSAGEIPARSHIRVIDPGETLASIAKTGGLGYPVTADPWDDDSEKALPATIQSPYVFHSLKERTASEQAAFFQGKKRRDHFDLPEDSFPNRLPDKFWDLPAKQAAIALAETNRTETNRRKWQLAVDDRHEITPPASGWLLHDWGSSSCYSYSSNLFALNFGVADPVLIVFGYNSIGAVGRNPWADQPMHNVRIIRLSEQEARFFADTIFWLDRIRTFSTRRNELDGLRGGSSTADGHATLTLYADPGPREIASGTVWAISSISGEWQADYNRSVFVNLAEYFMGTSIPDKLGDRWKDTPEIDSQYIGTSTKERLVPRVDNKARKQLSDSFASILARNTLSPLPPPVLKDLAYAAGAESLTELLPGLESLLAALPPTTEEDKEYEILEKRFSIDHFGNPLQDDKTAGYEKAKARYRQLDEKRKFLPSAILREPLTDSIRQLRLAGNAADLLKTATADGPDSNWALKQLFRTDPDAWAKLMVGRFHKAEPKSRNLLFETLATGNPSAARQVITGLTPADQLDLILQITSFHQEHDTAALATDIPVLTSAINDKTADPYRRAQMIAKLADLPLSPDQHSDFIKLLVEEIRQPQKGEYGFGTRASAIHALTQVAGSAGHLELITHTPGIVDDAFEPGFQAILKMAEGRPDRSLLLADYIRPRFTKSDGMMNDIFLHALAYDLRSLAPEIAAFATEDPDVQDGDAAEYSGGKFKSPVGQRYHIAREITALWSESDQTTSARLWPLLISAHPYPFDLEGSRSSLSGELRKLAATRIRELPQPQRREAIDSALFLIPIPNHQIATRNWLEGLGSADQ